MSNLNTPALPNGAAPGEIVRYEWGGEKQIERSAETSAAAVAAREQAAVQARYQMALMRRRNVENFRIALLNECKRPGFAELAEYSRPVGREKNENGKWEEKIAHGPSVHLIRTAIALYGNMLVDSATMYESAETRLVHAYVLDLENNVSWARTVALSKLVEKRAVEDRNTHKMGPPDGRTVVSERLNSRGEVTYTVLATEDETRVKEARLLAIAQRENGRSVLPRDIIDEAVQIAKDTLAKADAKDPDAARRKVFDAFAELNIKPDDLTEYLGHSLDRVTPAELKELRGVFVSLREGDSTWDDVMTIKNPAGSKEAAKKVAADKLAALDPKSKSESKSEASQPTATNPPESHVAAIEKYRELIGDQAYYRIIGANGYDAAAVIPADKWQPIAAELEQELKSRRESTAETKKEGRLKLGK